MVLDTPNAMPKRRGRPSKADTIAREAEAEDELLSPEQVQTDTLKRKRGRPSKVNDVPRGAAVDTDAEDELLSPEQPKPKKRGRKSNAELLETARVSNEEPRSKANRNRGEQQAGVEEAVAEVQTAEKPVASKQRRRSGVTREADDNGNQQTREKKGRRKRRNQIASADELESPATAKPVRRDRSQVGRTGRDNPTNGGNEGDLESPVRKKRGRPSLLKHTDAIISADELELQAKGKPSRPKQTDVSKTRRRMAVVTHDELEEQQQEPVTRKKRGRPSNAERAAVAEDEEDPSPEEPPTKKRRRRQQADVVEERPAEQISRKKRGRPSNAELAERLDGGEQPPKDSSTRKRKRKQDIEEAAVEAAPVPKYRHLAIVHRNVPRHTIDTKWTTLPKTAVDRVGQILQDVERAVVERIQNDGRRSQARMAVQLSVQKMMRKLNKLPFPPSTKAQREDEFDLERTLDSSNLLEDRLTPLLHSIDLLKAETRKEERLLEAEKAQLQQLELNAKAETIRRSQDAKKLHTVLRDHSGNLNSQAASENLIRKDLQDASLNAKSTDEDLKPVISELSSHLDSIKNNIAQVEGLGAAMSNSRAAVQDVLFRHLDAERYEHVVLG